MFLNQLQQGNTLVCQDFLITEHTQIPLTETTGYTAAEPAPDRRTVQPVHGCTDKDKHCPDKTETAPPTAGSYPPAIFSDDALSLTSHNASDENPLTDPVLTGASIRQ
ncbi:Uncharacterised protein [Providencia stuartii]|nr:Uncharacterised protein [Providencia stuartii]